jgi:hypothetical protein
MSSAGRIRTASASAVALYLAAAAFAVPEPGARAALHYALVAALGYGHLIGAWRPRLRRRGWLGSAALVVGIGNLLGLYALALSRWPFFAILLLGLSAWHTVENDLAFAHAWRRGHRLGPLPRRPGVQLGCAAATLAVIAVTRASLTDEELGPLAAAPLVTWSGRLVAGAARGLPHFADVFAALTLHHLVSWLLLLGQQVAGAARRDAAEAWGLARRIGSAHALPLALLLALGAAPGQESARLRALLVAPSLYLFFSSLHVLQTAWARGLEARSARAAA